MLRIGAATQIDGPGAPIVGRDAYASDAAEQ